MKLLEPVFNRFYRVSWLAGNMTMVNLQMLILNAGEIADKHLEGASSYFFLQKKCMHFLRWLEKKNSTSTYLQPHSRSWEPINAAKLILPPRHAVVEIPCICYFWACVGPNNAWLGLIPLLYGSDCVLNAF